MSPFERAGLYLEKGMIEGSVTLPFPSGADGLAVLLW